MSARANQAKAAAIEASKQTTLQRFLFFRQMTRA